jgi:hypothetical protein
MTYVSLLKYIGEYISYEMLEFDSSSESRRITHTFLSGKLSSTLIIPIDTARRYGLDKPANVVVEEKPEGILIKRLDLERLKTTEPYQK